MAKTLRTSGDYTVKAGAGSGGSNRITLDAYDVRIPGNLNVDGTQTIINSATLSVEDPILILSRNNSTPDDIDSGILVFRGASNNAAFYWNEGDEVFKAVTTTSSGAGTSITDTALAQIQAADISGGESGYTVANKNYVDAQIVAASGITSFDILGEDSTGLTVNNGDDITFTGGTNLNVVVSDGPGQVAISLNRDLNGIDTISTDRSDQDLTLSANQAGSIVIDDVLTFSGTATDPAGTPTATKIYHKTVGGGDTGIYFKNPNGTVGELISKAKATALAIALG